ncbi:hypothetical protein BGZ74_011724, partial [Mortierella antarctica]
MCKCKPFCSHTANIIMPDIAMGAPSDGPDRDVLAWCECCKERRPGPTCWFCCLCERCCGVHDCGRYNDPPPA